MSLKEIDRRTRMVFVCGPNSRTDQAKEDAWKIFSHVTDLSERHKKESFSNISMIQCEEDVSDYLVTSLVKTICANPGDSNEETVVLFAHEEGAQLVKKALHQDALAGYFRGHVPDDDIDNFIEDLRENLAVFAVDGTAIIGRDVAKISMNIILEISPEEETGKVQEKIDLDGVSYNEVRFQKEEKPESEPKPKSTWKDNLLASVEKSSESVKAMATYLSETITAGDLLNFVTLIITMAVKAKQ